MAFCSRCGRQLNEGEVCNCNIQYNAYNQQYDDINNSNWSNNQPEYNVNMEYVKKTAGNIFSQYLELIKNIFKDYIIYIYINCLIGLIPLYFMIKNILTVSWPSVICIIFSILSFLALAIFNYHQMKNELERRLHV